MANPERTTSSSESKKKNASFQRIGADMYKHIRSFSTHKIVSEPMTRYKKLC